MSAHDESYEKSAGPIEWPYPVRYGLENEVNTDVLVLGGGLSGCWAAISAARKGLKVAIVEKGCTVHSGAGGAGIDHWLCRGRISTARDPTDSCRPTASSDRSEPGRIPRTSRPADPSRRKAGRRSAPRSRLGGLLTKADSPVRDTFARIRPSRS